MNKRQIYFRADAGQNIGFGHFIRTLALADMLKNEFDCTFVTQNPNDYQKKEVAKTCKLVELPADDSKFNLFLEMLTGNEIVVLDNYFYTTEYQKSIKAKGCKLVCIDDMHDRHYVADVVINHGLTDASLFDVEPYTRLCLGLQWALLRKPFLEAAKTHRRSTEGRVTICFGGADKLHLTDKCLLLLLNEHWAKRIDVIVGTDYVCRANIDSSTVNIFFHRGIDAEAIADIFSSSMIAFLSASTVCIEALSCGCKVAAGWYVDNQHEFYNLLVANSYIEPLGYLPDTIDSLHLDISVWDDNYNSTNIAFNDVADNYIRLFSLLSNSENDKYSFIDYTQITELLSKEVWRVRNLPEIRCCMDTTQSFTYNQHLQFVNSLSDGNDKKYWAVVDNANNYVASFYVCDIDYVDRSAEWGLFINPDYTGRGIASKLADIFFLNVASSFRTIRAEVKTDNLNSLRFHFRKGFVEVGRDMKHVHMIKKI